MPSKPKALLLEVGQDRAGLAGGDASRASGSSGCVPVISPTPVSNSSNSQTWNLGRQPVLRRDAGWASAASSWRGSCEPIRSVDPSARVMQNAPVAAGVQDAPRAEAAHAPAAVVADRPVDDRLGPRDLRERHARRAEEPVADASPRRPTRVVCCRSDGEQDESTRSARRPTAEALVSSKNGTAHRPGLPSSGSRGRPASGRPRCRRPRAPSSCRRRCPGRPR